MSLSSYKVLVITLVVVIPISSVALLINLPTETLYSPFNSGVSGYSGVMELLYSSVAYGLSDIPKGFNGSILLPLTRDLVIHDYVVIKELVEGGVNLVVLDEYGYSNKLLNYLGVNAVVVSGVVLDEVFKGFSRYYPLIKFSLDSKSLELTTYRPAYVEVFDGDYSLIATTSNYSYVDVDGDGYYSVGEVMKPYIIVYSRRLGNGSITIITDLDVLSNELLSMNLVGIKELVGSPTYLVISYLNLSSVDYVKYLLTKLPIIKYRKDITSLITSYLIITTLSYTSYYVSFNGFSRRGLRPYILGGTYLLGVSVYYAVVSNDSLLIIPSITNLVLCLIKSDLRSPSTLTTLAYYSLINPNMIMYLIPLYFLTPYLVDPKVDTSVANFLGPTSTNLIKYSLMMLTTSLVSIYSLLMTSLIIFSVLTHTLIHYVKLSNVRVELLEVPNEVLLKSDASILLTTYSKSLTYLVVVNGGFKEVFRVSGYSMIKFPIPTQHLGSYSLIINLVVTDYLGISRRLLRPLSIKYVVVPTTLKYLEVIRSELFSRRDVKELLSDVELSITELGSGLVGFGVEEVSRVVSGLVRYGLRGGPVELIMSLVGFSEGFEGLGRRGRVGEYVGVRYYIPGDDFRHIHWSKSLSKTSLVVKEFTTSSTPEGSVVGGGLEPIVITDLVAYDVRDFDNIVLTLLTTFLSIVRVNPEVRTSLVLIYGDLVLVMRGKALDILYRLYKALSNLMPKLLYEYVPIKGSVSEGYVKYLIINLGNVKYFSKLVSANKSFTKELVKYLILNGLTPPKPYVIIHSDVFKVRYALVRYELSSYGYRDIGLSRLASYIALGGVK